MTKQSDAERDAQDLKQYEDMVKYGSSNPLIALWWAIALPVIRMFRSNKQ